MLRAAGKGAVSEKESKTALRMDLLCRNNLFRWGNCAGVPPPYQWNL